MADIVRRGFGGGLLPTRWDPFEVMRDFLSMDPWRGLQRTLGPSEQLSGFVPAFDVKETKDAFIMKADLPGVKEEDLEVSVTGNRLTISGKREEEHREEGETYHAYERSYGSFSRTMECPSGCDLDQIDAELKDGELTVVIPKKADVQPRKISLKGRGEKKAKA